jgi:rhamnosyltransferase subunit B
MHALIITAGSHGDINPFIAVARAIIARGGRATMLVNPYFERQVTEAGVGFIPFMEPFDLRDLAKEIPDIMHPRRAGRAVVEQLMLPHVEATFEQLPAILREVRPDVVLAHHICVGAPWACEQAQVPCAVAALAPMMWLSRGDTLSPVSWSPLNPGPIVRWLMRTIGPAALRLQFDPIINRARRKFDLPPQRDIFRSVTRESDLPLGLWSPTLRGPVEGDPDRAVICGFAWHDRHGDHEHAPADVEAFLNECERAGEPPILFSLGTAAVYVAGRFYHDAAEACRILDRRGLLLIGPTAAPPDNLPTGSRAFSYAPFSAVMPRCAVNVHHGGVGSTGQGLRAGRPTVIIPHAHDQFDNAARVKRLGVSETIARHRLTAPRLASALRSMLDHPTASATARDLGARIAAESGAETAAAAIEALAGATHRRDA